jgi:hypothetical protein
MSADSRQLPAPCNLRLYGSDENFVPSILLDKHTDYAFVYVVKRIIPFLPEQLRPAISALLKGHKAQEVI